MLGYASSPARRTSRSCLAAVLAVVVVASGLSLASPLVATAATPVGVANSAACGQAGSVNTGLVNVPDQVECAYFNRSADGHGGASDTFTVPDNTHVLNLTLNAGQFGGLTTSQLAVTPGQVLQVNVGGAGELGDFNGTSLGRRANGGWNGGGAGGTDGFACTINRCGDGGDGATDVRTGTFGLSDRVLVAGGAGGGAGDYGSSSGLGGGASGNDGYTEICDSCVGIYQGKGGGGSQQAGGYGGGNASGGGRGTGGQGGDAVPTIGAQAVGGNGGGGGYFGGGGGSGRVYGFCCLIYLAGGGAGGSGYAGVGTSNAVLTAGGGSGRPFTVIRSIPDSFATTTTVTADPNPSVIGQDITFTVTVTTADPATIPLGGGLAGLTYSIPGVTSRLNAPLVISPSTPGRGVATMTLTSAQAGEPLSVVGTAKFYANYLGYSQDSDTGTYTVLPSGSAELTQTVRKANTPQTITFGAPTGLALGSQLVDPGATASSGLPVTYAITTPTVCSLDQGQLYARAAGTCVVQADQAGDDTYLPAPQVERSVVIPKVASSVQFIQTPYGVRPGATSGLYGVRPDPGFFTVQVTSSTPAVCSVDPTSGAAGPVTGTFQALSGGTCTLNASVAGNADYESSETSTSFTIPALPKIDQTITFRTPTNAALGGESVTLDAFSTSGLPIVFSNYAPEVCTADSSGRLTTLTAGTCTVQADQLGNLQYNRAASVRVSFDVAKQSQTLTITSYPETPQVLGQYFPTGTSTSGLPVTFDASGACTITSNGLVNLTSGGTCTVTANQPGDYRYAAAPSKQQSFEVPLRPQRVEVAAPFNPVTGQDVTLRASQQGDSSSPVTYSVPDIQAGGCTLDGDTLSFVRSGPCIVLADQAGDTYYSAAPQFMLVFQVGLGPQTFALANAPTTAVAGERYTPVLIESGLTDRTYGADVAASPTTVCHSASPVAGVPYDYGVEFTAPGVCTLTVQKYGDFYRYLDSPVSTYEVTVVKPGQTVSFAAPAPTGKRVGDTYIPLISPGASSALPVLGTTSDAAVCTVANGPATFTGVGTCTLTLDQAGDATYGAAPTVTQSVTVAPASKKAQTVTFTSTAPASPAVGVAYPVAATATSGLTVAFTVTGSCTITSTGAGTASIKLTATTTPCTVTASQVGDATWSAATPVSQTLRVTATGRADLKVTTTPASGTIVGGPLTVTVTVTNVGTRDTGLATTQVVSSAPVTDAGGAVRSGKAAGPVTLTWKASSLAVGQSVTYTVVIAPRAKLTITTAKASTALADPTAANNVVVGSYRTK